MVGFREEGDSSFRRLQGMMMGKGNGMGMGMGMDDYHHSSGGERERELTSMPATPMGATPPFTPGTNSPPPHHHHHQHHHLGNSNSLSLSHQTPASTRPPSSLVSPSMPRSPLLKTPRTPWTPSLISPRFLSPIGTPMKRVLTNMKSYLEEVGHLTKLNPQDAWLPITESRNGNAYYAAFHNLNAGIGFQALILPVSFTFLGWSWGIIALTLAYIWQLYTLWILIKLHEAVPGKRYNRYVELAQAAFGEKLGVWLTLFPTIYLSAGTATAIILVGGETMKLFFQLVCGPTCGSNPLTTVEWYLVFVTLCIVLSQLPNLNSIAGLSLIGAITAITYCTMAWGISVSRPRPHGISYDILKAKTDTATAFTVLNSLGIVAFAFRGHNLALEIQATMPSSLKHPSHVPMWRGAKVAYVLIALCLFPIAIGGYWAYGDLMPATGMLNAIFAFHSQDISRGLLAATFLLVVFNCLSSFQIYSMPVFDSFEANYTSRTNKPCPVWVRAGFRVFYGFISFFIGVALPFLSGIAGLLGGLTLPVTFAYPCFMWVCIKKPKKYSTEWYVNWGLGILGIVFSLAFSIGGVWSMVERGMKFKLFKAT